MRIMRVMKRVTVRPRQMPEGKSILAPVSLQEGEHVLLLGPVYNMTGSVAISNWEGQVLWPINIQDLGEVDEHLPS